jgi:UDP-N-acetyl-D-glucosamine dehydrogenase
MSTGVSSRGRTLKRGKIMATAVITSVDKKESESVALQAKIETRQARIGVLGLGYVGLPLAVEFSKTGFSVTGFEVDPNRIRTLLDGQSYIADVPSSEVRAIVDKKRFTVTTNFTRLNAMDVIIICVPTPLSKAKDPDISYIAKATEAIAKGLHRQQLIVLESTTYPGTTREFMLPILEAQGLKVGKDFFLAFSPERIDPGNKQFHLTNTPKVVGGITADCGELAALLYSQVVDQVIPVSSAEAAEMVKILENTFRSVNIGLVNELALICDRLHLNVWEVIRAASTKPYGFMPFYPGPGLGGHCIPIDPLYLSWKMKSLNFSARFIELAGDVNSHMPDFVVEKTTLALNQRKKAVNGSRILLLGVSYKANVSDMRESPALDVMHLLLKLGADVNFHDPYVKAVEIDGQRFNGKPYSQALLKSMDAVIVTTAHNAFNPAEILQHAPLVIDTRNIAVGSQASNLVRL